MKVKLILSHLLVAACAALPVAAADQKKGAEDLVNPPSQPYSELADLKIITANGQVTLRGPVDSEGEKQLLGEIAGRIAGTQNVDNQLEVNQASNK